MRIATAENLVEVGNTAGESSQFNISMNSKMVKILSDMLYKDKIGSLVREISCNAFDAHVEAGKQDQPFYIHLPSITEPWFSVCDEGIGMSDTVIRETFTKYGESTKDLSDDAIGAFGLGCKTPFAYRDQFTITSIYDGTKTIFSAVINKSGIPELIPQAVIPVDAVNGIEIMVSADSKDFDAFKYAVRDQLKFFKVKPIITNYEDFNFNFNSETMVEYSDDFVTVFKDVSYNMRKIFIVQGGVGYPLDREKVSSDNLSLYNYLDGTGASIEFPIGDIDVVASRENVAYTDRTCDNINNRLSTIGKEMIKGIIEELKAETCFWNRAVTFNAKDSFIRELIYKNHPDILQHESFEYFNSFIRGHRDLGKVMWKYNKVRIQYRTKQKGMACAHDGRVIPTDDIVMFVKDTNKRYAMRINDYISENRVNSIMFMGESPDYFTDEKIAEYCELLGDVKILRVSELPDPNAPVKLPPGAKRKYKYAGKYTSYIRGPHHGFAPSDWDKIIEYDENETYYYVMTDRRCTQSREDDDAIAILANENTHVNIVAVNRAMFHDKVQKDKLPGTWIPAKEAAQKIIDSHEALIPYMNTVFKMREYQSEIPNLIKNLASKNITFKKNSRRFMRFLNIIDIRLARFIEYIESHKTNNRAVRSVYDKAESEYKESGMPVEIEKECDIFKLAFHEDYKMLRLMSSYTIRENMDIVEQYVNDMGKLDSLT